MRKKFICPRCATFVETDIDVDGYAVCPKCENDIYLPYFRETSLQSRVEELESQLAEAQARLAGFDPATKLPEFGTKVLVETPLLGGYSSFDFATYRADNTWQSETTAYRELRGITRWFPLPPAPKEEE